MSEYERPLADQVAIVTGASRGIGAATARALAEAGATVVVAARSAPALDALRDAIAADGGEAVSVPTDVTSPDAVRGLVDRTLDACGRLDVAFNNAAGGGHGPTPLADVEIDAYDSAITTSLRSVFLSMKYEIPAMLATGGGAIVNMSSSAGLHPVAGLAGYVSSKFGVIGLTRTAALDYADQGIRVNALAPGPILTEQLERVGERGQEMAARGVPMHRLGSVDDVAAAVVWLGSPASAFVTGVTLPMDGGMIAGMPPFARG